MEKAWIGVGRGEDGGVCVVWLMAEVVTSGGSLMAKTKAAMHMVHM